MSRARRITCAARSVIQVIHPSNLSPLGLASIIGYPVLRMLRSKEGHGWKKELDASSEGVKRKSVKGHKEGEVENNSNQNQSYGLGQTKGEMRVFLNNVLLDTTET